jgi:hypothetical protein
MSTPTMKLPAARGLAVLATVASLAALPAAASAHGGGGRTDRHSAAPARVTDRAARAIRAVQRASGSIDDGDATKAAANLKAARTNLASALKTAQKHVVTGDAAGPASADVVLAATHRVAAGAANLFDGQDGATVDALAETLKAADDDRDALVAAIAALPAADQAGYADVASGAAADVTAELSDLADALSDDTLTAAAKAALNAAVTHLGATKNALAALAGSASSSNNGADYLGTSNGSGRTDGGGRANCPKGSRGGNDSGAGTGTGSGSDYLSS